MTIEAIAAVAANALAQPLAGVSATQSQGPTGFSAMLDHLQEINRQMHANDKAVQSLALGETDNLHQVMMNMEQTRLMFDLALQVRNKTLEAYQELMRMQV